MRPIDALLTQIAQQHLGIETLQTRHSDSLDFHDLAVWNIRAALEAAFNAGLEQGRRAKSPDEANR
ncbi:MULTISPECIES: DUF6900 domain-containing protein [Betaproteobacteria]|uniref:DUF6900 domain-containing protein n=1 Tax=Sulfuricystis thermophila TaxID=2496847 RepID=UPI001035C668|nr:hypothetical protein [Sulfuricystis thermophila]